MKGQGIQEYEVVNELPSYFLRATNTHYMSLGGTLLKTPVDNPDALVGAPTGTSERTKCPREGALALFLRVCQIYTETLQ